MDYVYLDDSPVARFARARSTLRQSIPPPALGSPSWCCQCWREKRARGIRQEGTKKESSLASNTRSESELTWQDFFFRTFFMYSFRIRIRCCSFLTDDFKLVTNRRFISFYYNQWYCNVFLRKEKKLVKFIKYNHN